jgi:putative Mg2+ transporter-C (MgtC) family protein
MAAGLSNLEIIFRLLLSAVIGGLIGMEREANNRPAGLRTHVLVTLGASLIMLLSMYGFEGLGADGRGADPARLAAQVVSGIGFLGAGTILRTENKVSGLTTAASLWVCGGIGLAIGGGYYIGGLATAGIVLFTLRSLGFIEKKIFRKSYRVLIVQFLDRPGLIGDVGQILGDNNILIKDIRIVQDDEYEADDQQVVERRPVEVYFTVKIPGNLSGKRLFSELLNIEGIIFAQWADGKKRYPRGGGDKVQD